jgi:hypothetical protein
MHILPASALDNSISGGFTPDQWHYMTLPAIIYIAHD